MENFDWQTAIALTAVAAAVGFLVRRVYRIVMGNSKAGCSTGGCGSCGSQSSKTENGRELPLVTLNQSGDNTK